MKTTRSFKNLLFITTTLAFASCSSKMQFSTSPVVPAATGSVKVKNDRNDNHSIRVQVTHLAKPDRLAPPKKVYVVWMETPNGQLKNIGRLVSSSGLFSKSLKASLSTVSSHKPKQVFITAEDNGNVQQPEGYVVLTTTKKFDDVYRISQELQPANTSGPHDYSALHGTWELYYISGPRIAFDALYPEKKPTLTFTFGKYNEVGGNTGCNGFSSKMALQENKISISEPSTKTMIYCEGGGEETFLNLLRKVNRYEVEDSTLTFYIDKTAVMQFTKKVE